MTIFKRCAMNIPLMSIADEEATGMESKQAEAGVRGCSLYKWAKKKSTKSIQKKDVGNYQDLLGNGTWLTGYGRLN